MQGSELAQMIKEGKRPIVTFNGSIGGKECYLETGMRGQLVAISHERDDMFELHADLSRFDDFNRQFESANYYDEAGSPSLTAREAGFYKGPKETFWVGNDEEVNFCQIEEPGRLGLYEAYRSSSVDCTYVQWLEDCVLAQEATITKGGVA